MPNWFRYRHGSMAYGEAGRNESEASATGLTVFIGYGEGALDISNSATVTQSTSKTTGVTANANSGQITTSNSALASNAEVTFTVSNSNVRETDAIGVNYNGVGGYWIQPNNVRNGAFDIIIRNNSGSSLSDALVINFIRIAEE
jgi:hypothetical protein